MVIRSTYHMVNYWLSYHMVNYNYGYCFKCYKLRRRSIKNDKGSPFVLGVSYRELDDSPLESKWAAPPQLNKMVYEALQLLIDRQTNR